jgi:tripeptidyl-peptidase-1
MAHNYIIFVDGAMVSVDGTSASSPVFAGMLSLVNSQRVEAGKSTLGWVNPLLYKYYASFTNDITEGDKNACSSLEYNSDFHYFDDNDGYGYYHTCCQEGFYPTTGWDPITGLGSIMWKSFQRSSRH